MLCVQVWQPNDLVWVHDYHLMLMPRMLREQLSASGDPAVKASVIPSSLPFGPSCFKSSAKALQYHAL